MKKYLKYSVGVEFTVAIDDPGEVAGIILELGRVKGIEAVAIIRAKPTTTPPSADA